MWRWLLVSLPLLAAAPVDAARQRGGEELIQVVAPTSRAVADAHPHVNVVIAFGASKDGTPADPATFRAKLNGRDVTGEFRAVLTDGVETGRRAALPQPRLRLATAPRNRLRLSVQAVKTSGAKRARDVDRLRFGAADVANRPPVVMLAAGSDVTAVGVPVTFDASGSHDPDLDELSFEWSFSDGETASGPTVAHAFGPADSGMASANVVVSDGVDAVPQALSIPLALAPDPGRTQGTLRIEAAAPLEHAAVALGASATRSLTIRNVDATPTSQVKIRTMILGNAQFMAAPATLDLGPDGSATVDVTFAPTAAGHAGAQVMLVTSAANRPAVSFIAHGHGGAAPGDGPTLVDVPLFASFGSDVARLAPDGTRTPINAGIGLCTPPGTSSGGDVCAANGDCASGEVCEGAPVPIDVTDLCGDGQGVYVLSEQSYQDLRDDPDTELSGSLVRFDLDAAGTVTGRKVLYRTTDETTHLACDGAAAGAGGRVPRRVPDRARDRQLFARRARCAGRRQQEHGWGTGRERPRPHGRRRRRRRMRVPRRRERARRRGRRRQEVRRLQLARALAYRPRTTLVHPRRR